MSCPRFLALLVGCILTSRLEGAELLVPGQYQSLQLAVNAASPGDVVVLGPGTFSGTTTIGSKAITLRGQGAGQTVLSGPGSGPVLVISNVPAPGLRLEGLCISGGRTADSGAGVRVVNSTVRMSDCVLRDHVAHRDVGCAWCGSEIYGGALHVVGGSDVELARCVLEDNRVSQSFYAWAANGSARGGAIFASGSAVRLLECEIRENVARANDYPPPNNGNGAIARGAGIALTSGSNLSVTGSLVMGNRIFGDTCRGAFGAGIDVQDSTVQIADCRFLGNIAQAQAGPNHGAGLTIDGASSVQILSSEFVQNFAAAGDLIEAGSAVRLTSGSLTISNSSVCGSGTTPLLGAWTDGGGVDLATFCPTLEDLPPGPVRSVPGDHPTLQQAIDAASNGDVITLGPGTHVGPFSIHAKAVTIRGDPSGATVLAGNGSGPVLVISGVAIPRCRLERLTIAGGRSGENGAGLRITSSLVRLVGCTIRDHVAHRDVGCAWCGSEIYGGAIYAIGGSDLVLEGCTLEQNRVSQSFYAWGANGSARGGAVYASGCQVRMVECEIRGNVARANDYPPPANGNGSVAFGAGLAVAAGSVLSLENCLVGDNRIFGDTCRGAYGAGIDIRDSVGHLNTTRIRGNLAQANAGPNQGAGMRIDGVSVVSVEGCDLWANIASANGIPSPGSAIKVDSGTLSVGSSDVCGSGSQPLAGSWQDSGGVTWCVDSDGDGSPDMSDACPADPLRIDPGLCGCGMIGRDTDGDGLEDCCNGGTPACCLGDVDLDGSTTAKDLAAILFAWGPLVPGTAHLDLDGDGSIGGADLAIIVASWGDCP